MKLHFTYDEAFVAMDTLKAFGVSDIDMLEVKNAIEQYSKQEQVIDHTWGTITRNADGITIDFISDIAVKVISRTTIFAPLVHTVLNTVAMVKPMFGLLKATVGQFDEAWADFKTSFVNLTGDKIQHELYYYEWANVHYMTLVRRNQYGYAKPILHLWDTADPYEARLTSKEAMNVITDHEITPVIVEAEYRKNNVVSHDDIDAATTLLRAAMKTMSIEAFGDLCHRCHWATVHEAVTSPEANMCFAKLADMKTAK